MKLLAVFIKLRVKRRGAGRHLSPAVQTLLPQQSGPSSRDQLTTFCIRQVPRAPGPPRQASHTTTCCTWLRRTLVFLLWRKTDR